MHFSIQGDDMFQKRAQGMTSGIGISGIPPAKTATQTAQTRDARAGGAPTAGAQPQGPSGQMKNAGGPTDTFGTSTDNRLTQGLHDGGGDRR